MDKTTIVEVSLAVLGFSLVALSAYLTFHFNNYFYVTSIFFFVGLGIVSYALKYRDRDKIRKEMKEERERRKGIPKTDSEILSIIGFIVFCVGLGVGLISAYERLMFSFIALSLLLCGVGFLVMFISSIFVKRRETQRKREIIV